MLKLVSSLCLALLLGFLSSNVYAAPQAKVVLEGLGVPWGMTWWDAEHMIISERSGRLWRWHRQRGERVAMTGLPNIAVAGQGGLLDVQAYPPLHWQQGPSQWLYLTYSKQQGNQLVTVLARAQIENRQLHHWEDLLVTHTPSDDGRHFGSRITFDRDGHVYFGVGDRGERDLAQDLSNHAGKVMRLHLDGSVPQDNPFVGRQGARPEIFSYGHRNPQGLVYDEVSKRLWLMEHGPRGGDELNLVLVGRNYGWPVISYGKEYWAPLSVGEGTHKPGMEQPVHYYDPSIAPGSLLWYRGRAFPAWQNSLLAGALKLTHLNQLQLQEGVKQVKQERRWFRELGERIRALLESPEGWLYFSTDSGRIYLVQPGDK